MGLRENVVPFFLCGFAEVIYSRADPAITQDTQLFSKPYRMWKLLTPIVQALLITLAAGVTYFLTYKVNELLDSWVLYTQGIALVFLPAGIKHIAILIAGKWGALGCLVALFVLANDFWSGVPTEQIAAYSVISTAATWIGIILSMRLLQIDQGLRSLKFMHLPLMDLITTSIHGFTTNAFFLLAGMKSENFMGNALAMMFGDFVGSFIILTLLWSGLLLTRTRARLQQEG